MAQPSGALVHRSGGRSRSTKWVSRRALLYVVLVIGALVFAYPFLWMISTSLKSPTAVYQNSLQLIPRSFDWADYPQALNQFPFAQGLENTLIITVGVMVGTLVSVTLAAYTFSRLQFKFRDPLFYLCLSTMMIPYQVILLPQYILFRHLGWVGTFLPLIVPAFFAGGASGAFFIFMLRQFFLTIPRDCDEAAMLDGCGRLRVLWHVLLPEIKPTLIVVAMFTFLGTWNDFFGPLIYLTKTSTYTLALDFQVWATSEPLDQVMTVAILLTLAPAGLFLVLRKHLRRGIGIVVTVE